jgi:hypothetical protein
MMTTRLFGICDVDVQRHTTNTSTGSKVYSFSTTANLISDVHVHATQCSKLLADNTGYETSNNLIHIL